MSVKLPDLSLKYEGSVKRVWSAQDKDDVLLFEYTDDYSVFDWGKMPDTIAHKGRALTVMGAYFFEQLAKPQIWAALPSSPVLNKFDRNWLEARFAHPVYTDVLHDHGAPSHYKGLVGAGGRSISIPDAAITANPVYLQVLSAEVTRPEPFLLVAQTVYYYPRKLSVAPRRLVPLEVVFRFGMPAGSSLQGRLEKHPSYAQVLGLKKVPKPSEWFDRPVLEFFTKLEPKDRLLSIQEALLISGLSPERFEDMVEMAYLEALALYVVFAQKGIELWDGKFEFASGKEGLILVDSIGPDELRLIYKGRHLSKEMIRQVYRGSDWEKAIKESQQIARESGQHEWKEICRAQLKQEPAKLPDDFKKIIDQLYGTLTNHLVGAQLFGGHPTLDEFVQSLPEDKK